MGYESVPIRQFAFVVIIIRRTKLIFVEIIFRKIPPIVMLAQDIKIGFIVVLNLHQIYENL